MQICLPFNSLHFAVWLFDSDRNSLMCTAAIRPYHLPLRETCSQFLIAPLANVTDAPIASSDPGKRIFNPLCLKHPKFHFPLHYSNQFRRIEVRNTRFLPSWTNFEVIKELLYALNAAWLSLQITTRLSCNRSALNQAAALRQEKPIPVFIEEVDFAPEPCSVPQAYYLGH